MPFRSSSRGAYGPQGQKVMRGPLAPVWVTSGTLSQATPGTPYSVQLSATDDSGVAPTYTLLSGSLPSGLSISSSGLISGTPSNSGTFTFNVRATDENGRFTDSSTLTLVSVNPETTTPGGRVWNSPGTYSFTVPAGVLQVSAVAIGGGGGGGFDSTFNHGGGGAGLARSTWNTTPGHVYTIVVGSGGGKGSSTTAGSGGASYIQKDGTNYIIGYGGEGAQNSRGGNGGSAAVNVGTGGAYSGGYGSAGDHGDDGGGGGGAAGYVSNGGNGSAGTVIGQQQTFSSDSGRSGNGGTSGDGARGGYGDEAYATDAYNAGGGGGTNLYGGAGQIGGGDQGSQPGYYGASSGGYAGGGAGGGTSGKACCQDGRGAPGGVRIIWGKVSGNYRSFPNTNAADSTSYGGTSESANTNG